MYSDIVQIYFIFAMMLTIALVCFTGYLVWERMKESDISPYIPDKSYTAVFDSEVATVLLVYATFFILFNNLVPISLMFTVEMVKIVQAYFINSVSWFQFDQFQKMNTLFAIFELTQTGKCKSIKKFSLI